MSIQLSREPHRPQFEEGETYDARPIKVEEHNGVETAFGEKDQLWVTFDINDDAEITRRYTKSLNPKSNLSKLISVIDGENFDGINYDAEELVGKPCRVLIKHTKNDETGDVWDNIDTVLRPRFKQPQSLDDLANLEG
jgi:hypothetical protein